jgi:hypothetical protein
MVLFDEEPGPEKVDRLYFFHRSAPLENATCREECTLRLDLREDPQALLKKIEKTTAYEIRRAKDKDNVVCEYPEPGNADLLAEFYAFFTQFALAGDVEIPSRWFLNCLAAEGKLVFTVAKDAKGEVLGYHAYCRSEERVRLMHACTLHRTVQDSAVRAAIGRANRLLFWTDILHFKQHGVHALDFGGWYPGQSDTRRLGINKFKEGFGGRRASTYMCDRGCTLKGKTALWIRDRLAAWRGRKHE